MKSIVQWRVRESLVAVAALLSACTALPPAFRTTEIGVEHPESWAARAGAQGGVDDAWIDRFRDRRLTALVDEAMTRNPDLTAAAARVDRAAANVRIAGADARPDVSARGEAAREKRNFVGFPIFGTGPDDGGADGDVTGFTDDAFGVSLDVAWELDIWGRVRAGQSGAVARRQSAEADLQAARVSLAAQVAKAYFAMIEAGQQAALARATVASFRDTEAAIRERFELGQNDAGSLGADLRLAMSDVASAQADVALQEQARAEAARQLEVLLGRYPAGIVDVPSDLPALPGSPPAGLPSELLVRRPDIVSAERRFASAGARLKEARRAVFPQLSLTGRAGSSTDELADLLNSDFGVWRLASNVAQPIIAGGEIRGNIELRRADEREALADLQSVVLRAFSEVETALEVDRWLARREEALREAVRLAGEADEQARADYRLATGDFLTVLTSQLRLLRSRSSLLTVRRLRLDNRINLHLALGGGFRPQPAPAAEPSPAS